VVASRCQRFRIVAVNNCYRKYSWQLTVSLDWTLGLCRTLLMDQLQLFIFLRLYRENFHYIMWKSFAYRVVFVSVGELTCGSSSYYHYYCYLSLTHTYLLRRSSTYVSCSHTLHDYYTMTKAKKIKTPEILTHYYFSIINTVMDKVHPNTLKYFDNTIVGTMTN